MHILKTLVGLFLFYNKLKLINSVFLLSHPPPPTPKAALNTEYASAHTVTTERAFPPTAAHLALISVLSVEFHYRRSGSSERGACIHALVKLLSHLV